MVVGRMVGFANHVSTYNRSVKYYQTASYRFVEALISNYI